MVTPKRLPGIKAISRKSIPALTFGCITQEKSMVHIATQTPGILPKANRCTRVVRSVNSLAVETERKVCLLVGDEMLDRIRACAVPASAIKDTG